MTERDDGILGRWSRRKRAAERPDVEANAPGDPDGATPDAPGAPGVQVPSEEPDEQGAIPEDLPDIDSLDMTSDFTVFLKDGVPEAIRRRALRKLWRLNPVFANLDGLNDYDEDYTDAAVLTTSIKTIYKAGKGLLAKDEEEQVVAETTEPEAPDTEPESPDSGPESPDSEPEAPDSGPESLETAKAGESLGDLDDSEEEVAQTEPQAADGAPKEDQKTPAKRVAGQGAAERRWGAFFKS